MNDNLKTILSQVFNYLTALKNRNTVTISHTDFSDMVDMYSSAYVPADEATVYVLQNCGITPSIRMDPGRTKAFYADPSYTLTVNPPKAQVAEEQDEPWQLCASAALLIHTNTISRWERGINIVLRGKMDSLDHNPVLLAIQARTDGKDNLTIRQLYIPTADGKGVRRIPVTPDTVQMALHYLALSMEQLPLERGSLLNWKENLEKALNRTTGAEPPPPAP